MKTSKNSTSTQSDDEKKQKQSEANRRSYEKRKNDPAFKARRKQYMQKWRAEHPDEQLQRNYGITVAERDALFEKQGFKCAICAADSPGANRDWNVDHCHTTGKVRGVLCHKCNVALGLFGDNSHTLAQAIHYLEKHNGCGSH